MTCVFLELILDKNIVSSRSQFSGRRLLIVTIVAFVKSSFDVLLILLDKSDSFSGTDFALSVTFSEGPYRPIMANLWHS